MGFKIFITYSSRDRGDALRLKEIAEADGHDAWMDLFDIRPSAHRGRSGKRSLGGRRPRSCRIPLAGTLMSGARGIGSRQAQRPNIRLNAALLYSNRPINL